MDQRIGAHEQAKKDKKGDELKKKIAKADSDKWLNLAFGGIAINTKLGATNTTNTADQSEILPIKLDEIETTASVGVGYMDKLIARDLYLFWKGAEAYSAMKEEGENNHKLRKLFYDAVKLDLTFGTGRTIEREGFDKAFEFKTDSEFEVLLKYKLPIDKLFGFAPHKDL